ncbi:unnamed protein product [Aspergillus oryzae RIB40]|uniref:DNA, SC009 n=2 Tax=Aspergillus oryzae TaxID=5062 RepID=Q2UUY3_ASPOR|nr:unnamed protein product [Aspergillus oryzae RIB40]EIT79326.1 hypothetical protein Ao3042_04291 [Aspergillus oryzae 3.042]KDE83829.1 hypothetical protein AO1008_10280 [Aspergillus oryzae 100-8]BAE54632.1 unnamed protein product [Aspergillus oryzae RIB40]|eukprot:EIT79326.1 hypothetical protein Ao3042_04291 [Aspergillus oryzae 3.042]
MVLSPSDVPNKGPLFVKVTAVLTVIAFILVAYRIVWKVYMKSKIATDDAIISFSMAIQIVNTVMGDLACHYAFGRHRADVARTGGNRVLALKWYQLTLHDWVVLLALPDPLQTRPVPEQVILPRFLPPPLPNPQIPSRVLDHHRPRAIRYLRVRHRYNLPMHPRPRKLAQGHP